MHPKIRDVTNTLVSHVVRGSMRYRRHHGKTKLRSFEDLRGFNIVITTYHTLSADWNAQKEEAGSHIMFDVCWKRIILDEGLSSHVNHSSQQITAE